MQDRVKWSSYPQFLEVIVQGRINYPVHPKDAGFNQDMRGFALPWLCLSSLTQALPASNFSVSLPQFLH